MFAVARKKGKRRRSRHQDRPRISKRSVAGRISGRVTGTTARRSLTRPGRDRPQYQSPPLKPHDPVRTREEAQGPGPSHPALETDGAPAHSCRVPVRSPAPCLDQSQETGTAGRWRRLLGGRPAFHKAVLGWHQARMLLTDIGGERDSPVNADRAQNGWASPTVGAPIAGGLRCGVSRPSGHRSATTSYAGRAGLWLACGLAGLRSTDSVTRGLGDRAACAEPSF